MSRLQYLTCFLLLTFVSVAGGKHLLDGRCLIVATLESNGTLSTGLKGLDMGVESSVLSAIKIKSARSIRALLIWRSILSGYQALKINAAVNKILNCGIKALHDRHTRGVQAERCCHDRSCMHGFIRSRHAGDHYLVERELQSSSSNTQHLTAEHLHRNTEKTFSIDIPDKYPPEMCKVRVVSP